MKRVIADTNVFLRFLLNDVPQQADKAERLFIKAKKGNLELYIPQIVIFEIYFALEKYYSWSKEDIIEKLKTLITSKHFVIPEREIFTKALEIYKNKNISFVDSFIVSFSQLKDHEIFSFDKKLLKI